MGYHNEPFENVKPPENIWQFIGNILSWFWRRIRSLFARIKWFLRKLGLPIPFTLGDAIRTDFIKQPKRKWTWKEDQLPSQEEIQICIKEEIIPWLHETIMRAPNPMGVDEQVLMITVWQGYKQLADHNRMVDKYGWKKYARDEVENWLVNNLDVIGSGKLEIESEVLSPGRLVSGFRSRTKGD
jgi:hypothetical protein